MKQSNEIMNILQKGVISSLIEGLGEGTIDVHNEMLVSYIPCMIYMEEQIDLLKAIGLIHYDGNREAQLIINDFCGLIKDLQREGVEELRKR